MAHRYNLVLPQRVPDKLRIALLPGPARTYHVTEGIYVCKQLEAVTLGEDGRLNRFDAANPVYTGRYEEFMVDTVSGVVRYKGCRAETYLVGVGILQRRPPCPTISKYPGIIGICFHCKRGGSR
jgi:hypothetical protein